MMVTDSFVGMKIVRLNATLFPISTYEAAHYERFGLRPVQIEGESPEEILACAADCDGLLVVSGKLPQQVIEHLDRCRVISRLGSGTDKIDVAAATRGGIVVSNVPFFCYQEMADHAMTMLLMLARKIPQMSRYMYDGEFAQARAEGHQLRRLAGCVLGLVGFGATARAMARRAKAFGLRVLATRRNMNALPREADELGVEMVDLDTLLAQSDYVSLNLPLTLETYHLFDEATLRKMKPGACLINTARGAIVDEMALAAALREDRLGGAGLDTFEAIEIFAPNEAPPHHSLLELDNVIVTPHVSGLSAQAVEEAHTTGVENLVAVLSGHWPPCENVVNRDVVPRVPLAEPDPSLLQEYVV